MRDQGTWAKGGWKLRLGIFYLLVAGWTLWLRLRVSSEGIGWQDDVHSYSPHLAPDYWSFITEYYRTVAGRVGEESGLALISRIVSLTGASPLSIPWYTIRVIEAALPVLTFGNLFAASLRLTSEERPRTEWAAYVAGFVFFAMNGVLSQAMSMVINLVNYTTPYFLYSLAFLRYAQDPVKGFSRPGRIGVLLLLGYVALCHEQLLFQTSVVTFSVLLLTLVRDRIRLKEFLVRLGAVSAVYGLAAVIHFASPGLRSRMGVANPNHTLHFDWWINEICRTWMRLFHVSDAHFGMVRIALLAGLGAVTLYSAWLLLRCRAEAFTNRTARMLLGGLFVYGASASLITRLVAEYFPERGRVIPMVGLLTGTFLLVSWVAEELELRIRDRRGVRGARLVWVPLFVALLGQVPRYTREALEWWNAWDIIGGRAVVFYRRLDADARSSDAIVLYDYDRCHNISTTYDVPSTALDVIRWLGIEDKVEVIEAGKVINPKPAHLKRRPAPIECG